MRRIIRATGFGAVAIAAIGLTGANAGAAVHASSAAKVSATPTLKVTVTTNGTAKKPKYSGKVNRTTFQAGRINLKLVCRKGTGSRQNVAGSFSLTSFHGKYHGKAYGPHQYKADYNASQGGDKKALAALNRAVKHTTFLGGVSSGDGSAVTGSAVLKAGSYYVYNDTSALQNIAKLTVTGPVLTRAKPKLAGTIKANTDKNDESSFSGSKNLSHKGAIKFLDKKGSTTPHFLVLQHVKEGTTKKQIEDCFNDPQCSQGQPPFFLKAGADTDVVSPGVSMTINVKLPKGEYAEMCFFPDLKTGMPHAFMGMIRIVHLV